LRLRRCGPQVPDVRRSESIINDKLTIIALVLSMASSTDFEPSEIATDNQSELCTGDIFSD
jgi:hypothetical protein